MDYCRFSTRKFETKLGRVETRVSRVGTASERRERRSSIYAIQYISPVPRLITLVTDLTNSRKETQPAVSRGDPQVLETAPSMAMQPTVHEREPNAQRTHERTYPT